MFLHVPPVIQPPQPFHLNVQWTVSDIRMLLGSDLPIFGVDGHPAISLRLRYNYTSCRVKGCMETCSCYTCMHVVYTDLSLDGR